MKKSLFTKLIITYFVIIVISYTITAFFLSVWFYNYYYNQKVDALLREKYNLNRIVSEYIGKRTDEEKLMFELSVIDRLLNARIFVVDNYGYVLALTGNGLEEMKGKQIPIEDINDIRSGNDVIKTESSNKFFNKPMIAVGIPVVVDYQIKGGVLMYSPLDEINVTLKKVYFVIWMAAFFAILVSVFIIYFFSDNILIKPLSSINRIIKGIAKGDFDKRVEIESEDEIGELAASFNYMADSIENLESMRKNFIANISHELRSPMTSINGFIGGMIDGTIPKEKWTHYLLIVSDEIKRLTRLINDLLDLARLESGEFSLNMGTFSVNELIGERIIKFEDRIEKKQVDVDVILIDDKVKVKGDRDRIDQVLTNLLDNAIKFVPEKGKIIVKAEIKDDKVMVSVFNNGYGIPKEELKYIWDRFHKVDKARSKGGGTGLGLSIARQIINQHNQNIWVESGDFGTKFTFTLSLV